jgi:Fe-S-cluster containining protein
MTNSEDLFGPKIEPDLSQRDLGKCADCNAECCQYITVEIDKPKTKQDFDRIRWWLAHWNIWVYAHKNEQWYLRFFTRCKYLTPENWCWIYERRPLTCWNYDCNPEEQDPENKIELIFKSVADIETYAERILAQDENSEKNLATD